MDTTHTTSNEANQIADSQKAPELDIRAWKHNPPHGCDLSKSPRPVYRAYCPACANEKERQMATAQALKNV